MDDHDLLLRLEGKVDALTSTMATFIGSAGKLNDDHEVRIRSLERKVWSASAAVSVVVTALGLLVQYLFSIRPH
jgi:hypothetical protein